MKLKKVAAAAALSATAALFAVPASATVWTTTDSGNTNSNPYVNDTDISTAYGNSQSYSADGISLSAKGFSTAANDTTGTGGFAPSCLNAYSGGLGVVNRGSQEEGGAVQVDCEANPPYHSTDNSQGVDGVLMTFGQAVALTNVSIGWTNGAGSDSDFSVLYYTGGGANPAAPTMSYTSIGTMLTSGWSLLKNVDGGDSNASYSLGNTGSVKSSTYWYISAYSSSFGGLANNCDYAYDDYFKISGVTGYKVPEPATLTLFGLGLAGIGFARRRRRK